MKYNKNIWNIFKEILIQKTFGDYENAGDRIKDSSYVSEKVINIVQTNGENIGSSEDRLIEISYDFKMKEIKEATDLELYIKGCLSLTRHIVYEVSKIREKYNNSIFGPLTKLESEESLKLIGLKISECQDIFIERGEKEKFDEIFEGLFISELEMDAAHKAAKIYREVCEKMKIRTSEMEAEIKVLEEKERDLSSRFEEKRTFEYIYPARAGMIDLIFGKEERRALERELEITRNIIEMKYELYHNLDNYVGDIMVFSVLSKMKIDYIKKTSFNLENFVSHYLEIITQEL